MYRKQGIWLVSMLIMSVVWLLIALFNLEFAVFIVAGVFGIWHLFSYIAAFGHIIESRFVLLLGLLLAVSIPYAITGILLIIVCKSFQIQQLQPSLCMSSGPDIGFLILSFGITSLISCILLLTGMKRSPNIY